MTDEELGAVVRTYLADLFRPTDTRRWAIRNQHNVYAFDETGDFEPVAWFFGPDAPRLAEELVRGHSAALGSSGDSS